MSLIYGFKIFNTKRISEIIPMLGLTDFTNDILQGNLKNPTLNEVINFVYYECLPLFPFHVINAFLQRNEIKLFKRSITEHLYFSINMRMMFEKSLQNGPYQSLNNLLKKHVDYNEDEKYYTNLRIINDFYGKHYFKPTKPVESGQTDPYLFPYFQERLYALTIATRTSNPLFSDAQKTYGNLFRIHKNLSTECTDDFFSKVSKFIIESNYNFNFMGYASKYLLRKGISNVEHLKNIILFALMPNVNSRDQFFDVLLSYAESCEPSIDMIDLLERYLHSIESEHKGELLTSKVRNKEELFNQYSIHGILGNRFGQYLAGYKDSIVTSKLEECLHSLINFVFPLMEMYTYYLVNNIFKIEIKATNEFNYILTPQTNEELSEKEKVIFDMIAPLVYELKRISFSLDLPCTKEYFEKINNFQALTSKITLPNKFTEHPVLESTYNQYILSRHIIRDSKQKLNSSFYDMIQKETFLRNINLVRNLTKPTKEANK